MLRAMAGQVAKSAIVDPYPIAYLVGGRGKPVLLIHGFKGNRS
jgi:pimeloyl-ACP methyl ester carboxylesterase